MFIQMQKRKYTLKRRADDLSATRRRIVDATMALHEEIGPRATTISAIADRAGVQRLTVYRHFPDDSALFQACSTRWLELNPPPDPADWQAQPAARDRTLAATGALYAYYDGTSAMWQRVLRDGDVPALQAPLADFAAYLDAISADLAAAWHPRGRKPRPLVATIRHAVEFATWQSLAARGLSSTQAAGLASTWIAAAAGSAS